MLTVRISDSKKVGTFVVKKEFLTVCPNPEEYDIYDLLVKYRMANYLHNDAGPAAINNISGAMDYWQHGVHLCDEKGFKDKREALHKKYLFDKKLNEIIKED